MKSFVCRLITAVATGVATTAVASTSQQLQHINAMMDAQYQQGHFKQPAQCLGVTEQAILRASKQSMSVCVQGDLNEVDEAVLNACTDREMIKNLGVSSETMARCKAQFDDEGEADAFSSEEKALAEFWENVGDRDLTAAEEAELTRLEDAMSAAGVRAFESQAKATQAMLQSAAEGTEASITLPLYDNANIDAHYQQGYDFGNFKTLPVAMFTTQDKPNAVVAYYKKKLPAFKTYEFDGIGVMLLEKDPGVVFEFTDFAVYKNLPHVIIESLELQGDATKTRISLFYRK